MVRRLKEGYENEEFVAFYKGAKFYTGKLDDGFTDSLMKLMHRDSSAYDAVLLYLDKYNVGATIVDESDAAETLVQAMYYDAVSGDDYWNFYEFEIFPEYELDESIRRKTTKRFKENYYSDKDRYEWIEEAESWIDNWIGVPTYEEVEGECYHIDGVDDPIAYARELWSYMVPILREKGYNVR